MKVVEILGSLIDDAERQLIKVLGWGKDDVEEVNQITPSGIDSAPIQGMRAVYGKTSGDGDSVIMGYFNEEALAESGETRLFSINNAGELQTFIWLKKDGTIEIGGDTDFMVRFSALESAYNDLQSQWNTFATAYVPGSPTFLGTPPTAGVSTGDISAAKIDEIKTL